MDWLDRTCLNLAGISCLLLVGLTIEQVVARYFFSASSVGLQELQWHFFAMIFLLGAAPAFATDRHVRVDVLSSRMSPIVKAWIERFGTIVFMLPTSIVLVVSGSIIVSESLGYSLFRPDDYFAAALFEKVSFSYWLASTLEALLRKTVLIGEGSPDPGGLEARWLVRLLIPLCGLLLLLQSVRHLYRSVADSPAERSAALSNQPRTRPG
jgi:TRAP-type mannitol/chloroaromatic compound transport system permease small subunit